MRKLVKIVLTHEVGVSVDAQTDREALEMVKEAWREHMTSSMFSDDEIEDVEFYPCGDDSDENHRRPFTTWNYEEIEEFERGVDYWG